MNENNENRLLKEKDINQAYANYERMLSTKRARECLKKAEEILAFDVEVTLEPIRSDIAECMDLMGDLIRTHGTRSAVLQRKMPVITQLLEPAHRLAEEITKIEKRVAEIKKNHPDFIMAFKLQILLRKYEEMMDREDITPSDYEFIRRKYDQTRLTLHHHIQDKLRIAQRAFAPEMLELAQSHLGLSRHQEKILLIKQDLLETAQEHTHHTLQNLAQIFEEAEPELADTILAHTKALANTGNLTDNNPKKVPQSLDEFKEELIRQEMRLEQFENRLNNCMEQLHEVMEFEKMIFSTYGDQLRSRGIQFKKPTLPHKQGTLGKHATKKHGTRMVFRRG
ncbi:MAG: hypothetical protein ACOX5R_08775 [bacterium]|jgi:hypothetical protein